MLYVILRCRDCEAVMRIDARTKDWPACNACGSSQLALVMTLGSERVERAVDDDEWKRTYDAWKTRV